MNKIPSTYLKVEYDINGKPFLVEKKFTRGEYMLLASALNYKGETEDGNK